MDEFIKELDQNLDYRQNVYTVTTEKAFRIYLLWGKKQRSLLRTEKFSVTTQTAVLQPLRNALNSWGRMGRRQNASSIRLLMCP